MASSWAFVGTLRGRAISCTARSARNDEQAWALPSQTSRVPSKMGSCQPPSWTGGRLASANRDGWSLDAECRVMAEWANFYTLLGTGAATLLGLTFLALTFGGKLNSPERIRHVPLFVTPTVFHFSMVLLISAAMLIPDLASGGSMGLIA